jgi:hypothetical protein
VGYLNIYVTNRSATDPSLSERGENLNVPTGETMMENLAIVVVFALTLVAIVALGRGVRGKLGGIEIGTQQDPITKSKKRPR